MGSQKLRWQRQFLRPWVNDIAVVIFLVLISVELYFRHVARLSLSQDGFLLTYFMQTGGLSASDLNGIKDPGRPFLGLGWQIASLLSGGTVSGYNAFTFSCLTISAILVYLLARTLLPLQPVWALLVGTFKLVWSANYEIFDTSGLAIYFAETLFWLAFWLLTILAVKYERLSRFELIFASSVMVFCLLVVVGTYQTPWPVIILTPLGLMVLGVIRPGKYVPHRIGLVMWYFAALPMMYWCYAMTGQDYITHVVPPMSELFSRILAGLWAATGQALLVPFAAVKGYSSYGITQLVILTTAIFTVLLGWMGIQSWPDLCDKSPQQLAWALAVIAIIGFVIVVVSLLPPSLQWAPAYGTRFMHWPAIGTILGIAAALAAVLYIKHPWIGGVVTIVLFAEMMQQTYDVGNHYAVNGFKNRRFWEDLSVEIPNIDEGTIVLMDGPPPGISTVDSFSTQILRFMTETHLSFFITDGKPLYDPLKKTYEITTSINLNQVEPYRPALWGRPLEYSRHPGYLPKPHTFQAPAHRVVWVQWNEMSRRLQVMPERSAMDHVRRNVSSTYGQKLFPKRSIEYNRTRDNAPPF